MTIAEPPTGAQKNNRGFQATGLRLVHEFCSGSKLSSQHCVSQDGLEITDRFVLPSYSYPKSIPSMLHLPNGLEPHRIVEETYQIDANEIDKPVYGPLITQTRHLVSDTLANGPRWFSASSMARDKWHVQLLGPAVVGKVAAGTYWYLYLRKEHGMWKIWKFEVDE
jgi:hypothetical protein